MARKTGTPKAASTVLDQKFWQNFAKNHWEKKPLIARNVQSGLLQMTDAEIFDLLVTYSDRCREMNDPEGLKFFIDGVKSDPEEVLELLPEKSDKSLLGYHQRMNAEFSDYCLVCDELLQVNLKKQHLLQDFTEDLFRHVGLPNRFSEIGLYLGNYRKTPFGVHVDSCGVFSFPVAGVKRFRLWPAAYGDKHPELDRTFNYEKHKKHSQLVEVGPGDMTYWPSSEWHIAESDGSFSATWSLGVWVDQTHGDMFGTALRELVDTKLGASAAKVTTPFKTLHDKSGKLGDLPQIYKDSLKALKSLSAAELEEAFLKSWMKHISLQGFKTVPVSEVKVSAKSRLQLRSVRSPVLWQQTSMNKKHFSLSYGGVLVQSSSAGLLQMVKDLNAGKVCSPAQYLKTKGEKLDLGLLQELADAGAFHA